MGNRQQVILKILVIIRVTLSCEAHGDHPQISIPDSCTLRLPRDFTGLPMGPYRALTFFSSDLKYGPLFCR